MNIFAYTALSGLYPGYVSINRLADGDVSVSVRASPKEPGVPGEFASFVIPAAEWAQIKDAPG